MKRGEEYNTQQACVKYFRLKYPGYLIYSCPNEATYKNRGYFSPIGMLPGVADLTVVIPNKVIFFELKSKTGRQSVEQIEFMKKVEKLGFDYHIIRSVDDFIEIIENKLN